MIYLTNGNTPLNAAYADEIVQIDSNTYQLSFRFPTSNPLWEKLKEETFLTADDLHGEQDFVIFEVEKKHGYIQVYANQVFTLLNNYVVNPISLDRATGSTALSRFAGAITRNNPFSFFSDIEDRHTFNIGSNNAMEAFAKDKHSIIGQWGGDLVRHGYQVRLLKNGGSENESLFMYKKNLSSYQHKTSTKSLKTRITFKTTVKGEGEKAPDRKFSVVVDSPLINKYSQIYEDVIEVNDEDVKDEASLRKYGEQYFKTSLCDMMEDSLELEVVGQSDVPVQMYDIVSLFYEIYNLDVRKKITKYTYSPMAKKLKSIGFGQFQSGLANAIGNAVSDAVKGEAQQLQDDFERQLARELKNADLAFDRQKEELVNQFTDGLNVAKARAEEVKRQLSDTIDQRFNSFNNGPLQEAKRRAEEALRNAGASTLLAQEAKRISEQAKSELNNFKASAGRSQAKLTEDIETFKNQYGSKLNDVKRTADGLFFQMGKVESFIDADGQRQETLKKYARDESASQISAFRQVISSDYVAKNIYEEDVRGISQRIEAVKTEANKQVATQIASYKQSVDGKFTDISSQMTTYKKSADGQIVNLSTQIANNKKGTDGQIVNLSNQVSNNKINSDKQISNMSGQILANKASADSQIANVANQLSQKVEVTDFQRVKETSQLYERILGTSETGAPDKLSRLVMSSSIFQTEVGKYVTDDNNLVVNSEAMDKHTLVNPRQGNAIFVNDGVFTIKAQGLTSHNWSGFTLPIYVRKIYKGETYSLGFKYRIRGAIDFAFNVTIKNHILNHSIFTALVGKSNSPVSDEWKDFQWTFYMPSDFEFGNGVNFPFYCYVTRNGWVEIKEIMLVRGSNTGPYKPSQFDDAYKATENAKQLAENAQAKAVQVAEQANQAQQIAEATRTRVNQLAGSWAVQNLTSAGSIVSQINATNNQILIEAEKIRLKGKTLLDELTAIDGYFKRLFVGEGNFAKLNAEIIGANTITADKLIMDQAMARMFVSSDIFTDTLAAKEAFINKLRSVVVTATFLEGFQGKIGGFRLGQYKNRNGYFITGTDSVSIGMGNGTNAGANRNAFWANWGDSLDTPGPKSWNVNTDGTMYCRNEASFYSKVDFASTSKVNFYSRVNAEKGLWLAYNDVLGEGDNPAGGYNRVVWWSQIVTGNFRQHAGITTASDRKLKENIEPTPIQALEKINALNLVTFDYIKDKTHEEIGLIAQEVLNIIPGSVEKYEGEDNHLTINYSKFVPYLIKAVQELNQKIEKLEKTA